MNIALILQHKLWLGVQQWVGSAVHDRSRQASSQRPFTGAHAGVAPAGVHTALASTPANRYAPATPQHAMPAPMPLRVFRVVEKDQPRSCSGRMVISGRMADVCAELDRLAAKEAALH
jgi:hypothetical protein